MRIDSKRVLLGVPMLMVAAMVAVMALWVTGIIGGGGVFGGPSSQAAITWNVEYWHRNAAGEVLQHKKDSNAIVASGLEHAMERLINATAPVLSFANVAQTNIGEANAFDQIVLMNLDDDPVNGLLATNILLNVDGGTGNNTGQVAAGVENNPADGAWSDTGGDSTDGTGEITLKFLADGDPLTATQMHLVKSVVDDTTDSGQAAIAAEDILATIEIEVNLADTDTLTITWTINVT